MKKVDTFDFYLRSRDFYQPWWDCDATGCNSV